MQKIVKPIFYLFLVLGYVNTYSQGIDWKQTNGPVGGIVKSVGKHNNILFAVTEGNLFRSTDSGISWQSSIGGLRAFSTEVVSSNNGYVFFGNNNKLYKSSDNGITWSVQEISTNTVRHLTANSNGELFIATQKEVYFSHDNGITWGSNQQILSLNNITGIVSDGINCFLSSDKGIFRSTDKGQTWFNVTNDLPAGSYYSVFLKNGKLFAGSETGIYTSDNNGGTWALRSTDINNMVTNFSTDSSGNIYAVTTNFLLKSTDAGTTWKKIVSMPLYSYLNNNIIFNSDGSSYAAGNNGVINFTANMVTSKVLNNGIIATATYIVSNTKKGHVFTTTSSDVYKTTDGGGTWKSTETNEFESHSLSLAIDKHDVIYSGVMKGYIKSTDDGLNWTQTSVGNSPGMKSFAFSGDSICYILSNNAIYKSINNGFTWRKTFSFKDDAIFGYNIVTDKYGYVYFNLADGVYRSADEGETFTKVSTGNYSYWCIHVTRLGTVIAGISTGLLVSTDQGITWSQQNIYASHNDVSSISELGNGTLIITTTDGLFSSTNDGKTWVNLDYSDTRGFYISSLCADNDGFLYANTIGRGVYKSSVPFIKIKSPLPSALPGSQKAYLSWDKNASANFKYYRVYGSSSHYPTTLVYTASGGINDTMAVIPNLANGAPYYFVVSAVDNDDNESFSVEFSVTPVPSPSVPVLVSPVNSTPNTPLALQLKWNNSTNASSYHVQVSNDSNFVNIVLDFPGVTDTLKDLTGLSYLTTYYWRVKAKGIVEESSWSQQYSFTSIVEAPEKTASVLPVNNAVNLPIQQTFSWLASARAQHYHLQVASDDAFTSLVINDSTLADTTYSKTLAHNKKYFWKVKAVNAGGSGAWSDTWNFTTIIAAPDSVNNFYPSANAVNVPALFNFRWNKSNRAETYHFQLSQDSLFENTVTDDSTLADTLISSGMLTFDTKYFWRVKAKNIGGTTDWSGVMSFTTIIAAPDAPYLSQPANDSTGLPVNLKFSWFKLNNAEKYHLQVSESKAFTSFAFNDSLLADTLKQVNNLKNKTVYYWRVKALNIGGSSQWSEVWSFKTIVAIPAAPVLVSPANGAKNIVKNTQFKWNAVQDAETYRLQVFTDADLSSAFEDDSIITSAEKQLSGLKSGMKYFWRVNAKNDAGTGSFSPVWSFITLLEAPAITVETAGIRTNKLTWTDNSDNESGFIVERNTDSQIGYKLLDTVKANETTYIDSTASSAVTYKYRVKAYTEFAVSDYSNEAVITTITSVNDYSPIPTEYSIKQNYPNPFNPSTLIEYNLPYESSVKVIIYNSIGQVVAELAGGVKPAGHYQVSFNAASLASGIYFCSIRAESTDGKDHFSSIKKMILMK